MGIDGCGARTARRDRRAARRRLTRRGRRHRRRRGRVHRRPSAVHEAGHPTRLDLCAAPALQGRGLPAHLHGQRGHRGDEGSPRRVLRGPGGDRRIAADVHRRRCATPDVEQAGRAAQRCDRRIGIGQHPRLGSRTGQGCRPRRRAGPHRPENARKPTPEEPPPEEPPPEEPPP